MANTNSPYGFQPINPLELKNTYTIASGYGTAINFGDPVKLTGTGSGKFAGIEIAVSDTNVIGVFAGVFYTDSVTGAVVFSKNWTASLTGTNIRALVWDNPETRFKVQASGAFAVTNYGQLADFATGTGSQGISGYTLDSTTLGTGTDLQVLGAWEGVQNEIGTYAQLVVLFAKHSLAYPHTQV